MIEISNKGYLDMHLVYDEMQCNSRDAEQRYGKQYQSQFTFIAVDQRLHSMLDKYNLTF